MPTRRVLMSHAVGAGVAAALAPRGVRAQAPIAERAVPKTGERLPVVALGTSRTFEVGESFDERAPLRRVVELFFDEGGRVVDSSPQYGVAEAVFGDVYRNVDPFAEPFIATKVSASGRDEGIGQMQASPDRMGAGRVDLMQVHNLRDWRTHLPTMKDWKAEGRFRYIGISASREPLYDEFIRVMRAEPLDFVQINYSVAERACEDVILPLAQERGMAVLINRPFARGALFGEVSGQPLPPWAAEFDCHSWAQFFLKYCLSHPAVTSVIQATSDPDHLVDNMQAGRGRLPDAGHRRRMVELIGVSGRPPWD